jgi:dipeptidase E
MHDRKDLKYEIWDSLRDKTLIDLQGFDAVYIGGGNTWNLYKEIIDSGFDTTLIKYINEGGLAYGGSAGAIIFGKLINTQSDDKNVDVKKEGLNMLEGNSVVCHYAIESKDFYTQFAKDNMTDILCLYEESGVVFSKGRFSDCGSKKSLVIKSI